MVIHGDCRAVLATMAPDTFDACVTDPPYGLEFMGKSWDATGVANDPDTWCAVYRALKPGAHLVAFGGSRTHHRLMCAIEDAGFEIRDTLCWLYGTGFPKSHDISKAIDKAAGAEREIVGFDEQKFRPNRDKYLLAGQPGGGGKLAADNGATLTTPATPEAQQWAGWGTALKPSVEFICLARKPLSERTVAANVLAHGTGAINIDACRVAAWDGDSTARNPALVRATSAPFGRGAAMGGNGSDLGRWPANVLHDGSDEVEVAFAAFGSRRSAGDYPSDGVGTGNGVTYLPTKAQGHLYADSGTASRFFYAAKASKAERNGSKHPTVKPLSLIRYLVRLITPPHGHVLDPFAGSGTTAEAAALEGFQYTVVEQQVDYIADIHSRMARYLAAAGLFAVAD